MIPRKKDIEPTTYTANLATTIPSYYLKPLIIRIILIMEWMGDYIWQEYFTSWLVLTWSQLFFNIFSWALLIRFLNHYQCRLIRKERKDIIIKSWFGWGSSLTRTICNNKIMILIGIVSDIDHFKLDMFTKRTRY